MEIIETKIFCGTIEILRGHSTLILKLNSHLIVLKCRSVVSKMHPLLYIANAQRLPKTKLVNSQSHQRKKKKKNSGYLNTLIYEKNKECLVCVSSTMLSPLVSWILSSSSSSSSSSSEEEEEEESLDITTEELDHENDNVVDEDNLDQHQNDHFLTSCDVDDDTIPLALAIPNASPVVTVAFPTADKKTTVPSVATTTIVTRPKRQRSERTTNYYGAARQYQRLWTKQDEMELLKGYLDYTKQHRKETTTSLQNDVALLYDHVSPKLNVGFNKNQLVEKLRRLKRKYKVSMEKVNSTKENPFKSLHDKAIFEISHKIWGNEKDQDGFDGYGSSPVTESHDVGNVNNCDEIENKVPKRLRLFTKEGVNRSNDHNNDDSIIGIEGFIDETMRSCFSPLLKEVLDNAHEGLELKPMALCSGELRKRRILELEVYLNRLELLQSQIKARLEELRTGLTQETSPCFKPSAHPTQSPV